MFRVLIYLSLGLTILFVPLIAMGTVIGRGMDTPAAAALVSPQGDFTHDRTRIALFDLKHLLRAETVLPEFPQAEVLQIDFIPALPDHIIFATYSSDTEQRRYQARLYLYNYLSRNLITITTGDSERPFRFANSPTGPGNRLFYNIAPFASHDGQQIAFVDPVDQKPYLFNLRDHQLQLLLDSELRLESLPGIITLSPDNTKIAVKDDAIVYIFSAGENGGQPVELQQFDYPAARANFTVNWSADSRYIVLHRWIMESQTSNAPIRVLNVIDGTEHPFVQDISAHWADWDCDGRWLYYVVGSPAQSEGYLLDLHNGEIIRVNDAPLLVDVNINSIYPVADCDQFLIEAVRTITSPVPTTTQTIYVFDIESQTASLVDENILTSRFQDETLYYIKLDLVTSQHPRLSRSLNPIGQITPLEITFPITAIWKSEDSILTFDYFDGRVTSEWPGGELGILDLQTASWQMLTSVDERVLDHQRYRWSEIRNQPWDRPG